MTQVYGTLEFTNFNGVLVVRRCSLCKGTRVNLLATGGYYFLCLKSAALFETLSLEGSVLQPYGVHVKVSVARSSIAFERACLAGVL